MDGQARATSPVTRTEGMAMALVSALLIAASHFQWWSIALVESLGFATGGVCVWLTVRQNLWTWPIGLANNVFFFISFWKARIFADMWLQVIYFGLGIYGWLHWMRGGTGHTELRVSRASRWEWVGLAGFIALGTWVMHAVLVANGGAAPFWDALTTALSLGAQYLLCRKRLENWFIWIAADIIYVPLYISRGLALTAVLYGVFLTMCFIGLRQWWQSLRVQAAREVLR